MKTIIHFVSYLAQFYLELGKFQAKVVQKIKTHFMFNNFFSPKIVLFFEIMWKNTVEPDKPQITVWRMRIAFWILKSTNTHSECVLVIALPLQQWLRERASMLRYTYPAGLVITSM
jgi:hypothetical protein